MFSLIRRIFRLFTAKGHDLVDNLEDPGSTARQNVRDLANEIARCEEAITTVVADQTLLEKRYREAKGKAVLAGNKAEEALEHGDETLARQAMDIAEREQKRADDYEQSLRVVRPRAESLRAKLSELRRMKESVEGDIEMLEARATAARATEKAIKIMGGIGNTSVNLEQTRQRVEQMEARADAVAEIAHDKEKEAIDVAFVEVTQLPLKARLEQLRGRQADAAPAIAHEG